MECPQFKLIARAEPGIQAIEDLIKLPDDIPFGQHSGTRPHHETLTDGLPKSEEDTVGSHAEEDSGTTTSPELTHTANSLYRLYTARLRYKDAKTLHQNYSKHPHSIDCTNSQVQLDSRRQELEIEKRKTLPDWAHLNASYSEAYQVISESLVHKGIPDNELAEVLSWIQDSSEPSIGRTGECSSGLNVWG
jgi:hypothetical protein